MLRRVSVLLTLAILAITASNVSATTIERDPTKRKGAGAPFQIRRGKLWGYMDRTGKVIIEPQFDYEGDFFHGVARVRKNRKWGYIDEKGKQVIPFSFDDALDFIGEIAPVRVGRQWGYIDLSGRWIVTPRFQAAGEFVDGRARVVLWTRVQCGNGKSVPNNEAPEHVFVIPDILVLLTGGCSPVDDRYGFIDKSGRFVIEPQLQRAEDFSEGVAAFATGNKFGYIDVDGNVVIAAQFEQAENFAEGLAVAQRNNKWGYIDKSGRWVIEPRFDLGSAFSEGLARVIPSIGSGSGYIDRRGQIVIKSEFESAMSFSEGLSLVWKNDQSSYINTSGTIVLTLTKARWRFSDGLTVIGEYPDRVYVDKQGKTVAPYEVGSEFE
ncbi:MAG TPA: WG repeat-containing protein [Pyrinomonadaceae bacterium]|nr:WG repeat-containing protein [Pyrinomonadaceae bacterium]